MGPLYLTIPIQLYTAVRHAYVEHRKPKLRMRCYLQCHAWSMNTALWHFQ